MGQKSKDTVESTGIQHIDSSNSKTKKLSAMELDGEKSLSEVFEGNADKGFTLKRTLEFMEVTESEFLKLLKVSGNSPSGKLDKKQIFFSELIFEIDSGKWKAY